MATFIKPGYRAAAAGVLSALLLIGAFLIGTASSSSAAGSGTNGSASQAVTSASKITVSGTGTVTGVPNQLVLSMGVQTSASSVSTALREANGAIRRVMAALSRNGVPGKDVQTSGLSIQPNYSGNSQYPTGYDVTEQLSATLNNLGRAGSQIQAAANAGGNATTIDGVSLNLTDTGGLLARARAAAVADAHAKAQQFAAALGQRLGPVLSVSDQSAFNPYPVYYGYASSAAQLRSPAPKVPVSPGTQQVSVQITVIYSVG